MGHAAKWSRIEHLKCETKADPLATTYFTVALVLYVVALGAIVYVKFFTGGLAEAPVEVPKGKGGRGKKGKKGGK